VLLLVVDEFATRDDLRVDQASEFAEVAIVLGAILVVPEDELVNVMEGDVQLIEEPLTTRTLVIAQDMDGGGRVLAPRVRHKRSDLLSQNDLDQNKVGKSGLTVHVGVAKSKRRDELSALSHQRSVKATATAKTSPQRRGGKGKRQE
jgi:hypothetical protein